MNKHIVRHEDGNTSTRNSQNRVYTHAIAIGPDNPEMVIAVEIAQAQAKVLKVAAKRDAFIASGKKVSIRRRNVGPRYINDADKDLGWSGTHSFTNYEYITADGYSWGFCDSTGNDSSTKYNASNITAWIERSLDSSLSQARNHLETTQAKTPATVKCTKIWSVITWCGRLDLAQKQYDKYAAGCALSGAPIHIVEVERIS